MGRTTKIFSYSVLYWGVHTKEKHVSMPCVALLHASAHPWRYFKNIRNFRISVPKMGTDSDPKTRGQKQGYLQSEMSLVPVGGWVGGWNVFSGMGAWVRVEWVAGWRK